MQAQDVPAGDTLSLVHGASLEGEVGGLRLTIAGYLRELARRHGGAEALVEWVAGQRIAWTYADLLDRAVEVAAALVADGLGKDGRVGILMTNRLEFLSALFGTGLAGGVPVPMSTFATPGELDHMLRASQVSVLLAERHVAGKDFAAMLGQLDPAGFPFLRRVVMLADGDGDWARFLSGGAEVPAAQVLARADTVHPADFGGIFFSSGTTSLPKGIVHSQRAFAIQWWRWPRVFGMDRAVNSWTCNGFFWSGNVSMVVGAALSTGGKVVLQRTFDAAESVRLFEAERVNFINGRPHQWVRLTSAPNWAGADLSSIRYVPRGEQIWAHPTVNTDWETPMSFGTTETMTICTSLSEGGSAAAGSCGRPLPGNVLKIVDPFTGAILPRGEVGEMCIKGPTLMSGYLGKSPEDCFDAEGFYRTSDGGWVDDAGTFFWDGRLTDMIKTGGANVSPLEVDEAVAKSPGVKRTQTVGVPDGLLGEMVVTCIVPMDGASLDPAEITAFLKREVASFKVPKRILFCTEAEFSITGNEKARSADIKALAIRRIEAENAGAA